jgi:hypothetical protein
MLIKKIIHRCLIPLTLCVITTLRSSQNNTIGNEKSISKYDIIIRYIVAFLIGLLCESYIYFIGREFKRVQIYEKTKKNKPSILKWLKYFVFFGLLGFFIPMSLLFPLSMIFIFQINSISILYMLKTFFITFLIASFFLSIILYLISLTYSNRKE